MPDKHSAQRGTITVETLLVLFPFLTAVLVALQFILLALAQQIFDHALYRAARASSVLTFEPSEYFSDAPIGQVTEGTPRYEAILDASEAILSLLPSPWVPGALNTAFSRPTIIETGLTMAGSRGAYIHLSFHQSPTTNAPLSQVSTNDTTYLRLSYLHRCRVPLVNRLICRSSNQASERQEKRKTLGPRQQGRMSRIRKPDRFMIDGEYFRFKGQVPVSITPAEYLQ